MSVYISPESKESTKISSRDEQGVLKALPKPHMGSMMLHSSHTVPTSCESFCKLCDYDNLSTCIEKCSKERSSHTWSCKKFT